MNECPVPPSHPTKHGSVQAAAAATCPMFSAALSVAAAMSSSAKHSLERGLDRCMQCPLSRLPCSCGGAVEAGGRFCTVASVHRASECRARKRLVFLVEGRCHRRAVSAAATSSTGQHHMAVGPPPPPPPHASSPGTMAIGVTAPAQQSLINNA